MINRCKYMVCNLESKMKLIAILLLCLVLGGCRSEYNNVIELDSGKISLDSLDNDGWLRFSTKEGATAWLQFSGIRELDRFYVNYLDSNGEIKDEKLLELKKRMEGLKEQ